MAEPDHPDTGTDSGESAGRRWRLGLRQRPGSESTVGTPRTAPDDPLAGPTTYLGALGTAGPLERPMATGQLPGARAWPPSASVETTMPVVRSGGTPDTMALAVRPAAPEQAVPEQAVPEQPSGRAEAGAPDTPAVSGESPQPWDQRPATFEEDPVTPAFGMVSLPRSLPPPPFRGTPSWPSAIEVPKPLPHPHQPAPRPLPSSRPIPSPISNWRPSWLSPAPAAPARDPGRAPGSPTGYPEPTLAGPTGGVGPAIELPPFPPPAGYTYPGNYAPLDPAPPSGHAPPAGASEPGHYAHPSSYREPAGSPPPGDPAVEPAWSAEEVEQTVALTAVVAPAPAANERTAEMPDQHEGADPREVPGQPEACTQPENPSHPENPTQPEVPGLPELAARTEPSGDEALDQVTADHAAAPATETGTEDPHNTAQPDTDTDTSTDEYPADPTPPENHEPPRPAEAPRNQPREAVAGISPAKPVPQPSAMASRWREAPTFSDVVLAYVPPYPAPVVPAGQAPRRESSPPRGRADRARPEKPSEPALADWQQRRQVSADEITHESVVEPDEAVPRRGWRARLFSATGGRVNPGIGSDERAHLDVLERIRRQVHGPRQIAVSSIKGGVGKTTVSACLGLTLAEYRGDGVIAVDADPDAGNLADRLTGQPDVTVRHLLADLDAISALSDFGLYTSLAGRLRVLAGDQEPEAGEAFRRDEYERVCDTLTRFFDIIITDSGTGLVHDTMRGILTRADRLIVVGSPTVDGASRASKTLDWLLAHGHERLADDAVVVLSGDRGSAKVNYDQLRSHFRRRSQHVIEVPADPHLYSGSIIDLNLLQPTTRGAYLELAAVIADGFEDELFTFTGRR